jgi:hypothetical protein
VRSARIQLHTQLGQHRLQQRTQLVNGRPAIPPDIA